MNAREVLIYLSIKHEGDYNSILSDISNKVYPSKEELDECLFKHSEDFVNAITMLDKDFPNELKNYPMAPLVLFYKGNKKLLKSEHTICIAGTRNPSEKAISNTIRCAKDYVSKNYVLVNSLARGVSEIALEQFIIKNQKCIVVLASGLDNVYPTENEELLDQVLNNGGLVITEYPSFTMASNEKFMARQRIMAMVGKELIVSHLTQKSGTCVLVNQFLQFNREIMAIPDTEDKDNYCNNLVMEGATPALEYCFD